MTKEKENISLDLQKCKEELETMTIRREELKKLSGLNLELKESNRKLIEESKQRTGRIQKMLNELDLKTNDNKELKKQVEIINRKLQEIVEEEEKKSIELSKCTEQVSGLNNENKTQFSVIREKLEEIKELRSQIESLSQEKVILEKTISDYLTEAVKEKR